MNKRIRELAEQAGAKYYVRADYLLTTDLDVEQFAALIRQDENEACAKIVDENLFLLVAAAAIRARGDKHD